MTGEISRRSLNRAMLARQMLLQRWDFTPLEAMERLVGLQAQTPHTWYVGLWTRLTNLSASAVSALLEGRKLVRIALMRSTIHLVTAEDALALRALLQVVGLRAASRARSARISWVSIWMRSRRQGGKSLPHNR